MLLYEALAGRHPFWRPSLGETAEAIAQGPPPLRTERPDLPDRLLAAVDRALVVDPKKRPSAAKLARMLGRARGDDRGAARDVTSFAHQLLPALATGVYAAGAAALLPFYPARAALPIGVAAAALTLGAPRFGLAFALAVPIFPLGNAALGLALLYTALAAAAWLALVLTRGAARRAVAAAARCRSPRRRERRASRADRPRDPGQPPSDRRGRGAARGRSAVARLAGSARRSGRLRPALGRPADARVGP